jgi:hypothetical protein
MPKSHCPGFDPTILRHNGISGAADEAVLNKVGTLQKIQNNPLFRYAGQKKYQELESLLFEGASLFFANNEIESGLDLGKNSEL